LSSLQPFKLSGSAAERRIIGNSKSLSVITVIQKESRRLSRRARKHENVGVEKKRFSIIGDLIEPSAVWRHLAVIRRDAPHMCRRSMTNCSFEILTGYLAKMAPEAAEAAMLSDGINEREQQIL